MRSLPFASTLALLACSCLAAPIAENAALLDQVEENNYAMSASKDWWTTNLAAPAVDALVQAEWADDPAGPGCAVGLVQGGETIYLKGYGMASPTEPWSVETVAPVGSISKTITALALRRLDQELGAGLDLSDALGDHLPASALDAATLAALLSHSTGVQRDPGIWDPGSLPTACGGSCDDERWSMSRPRVGWDQMDDGVQDLGSADYSNVGYTALGAAIDELTHDDGSLWPWERGYEAYTWHRVGRFAENDTWRGQLLTLALTHSWRVDAHDLPHYAHGRHYTTGASFEAWDDVGFEGWEGPSGGWVMSIGDLSRLIEQFAKFEVLDEATMRDMVTVRSDVLGGYGHGVIVEGEPDLGGFGGANGGGEGPDHLWWHGGDIGGHTAVWTWWPDLQEEHGKEPFGVALVCNRRDGEHASGNLLGLARDVKDLYLTSGIAVVNDLPVVADVTLREVDGHDYRLDLRTARIVDPPSFFLPVDQARDPLWLTVDAADPRSARLALVAGETPEDRDATVTPLGTSAFVTGEPVRAGAGAAMAIEVPGLGTYALRDVRLSTAFAEGGRDLAAPTLTATLDVRQLDERHDDGWRAICADLAGEAACAPCSDHVPACLDVTVGSIRGEAR